MQERKLPNMGKRLENKVKELGKTRSAFAQQMGVPLSTFYNSIQTNVSLSILWKASIAANHNFFAELGEEISVDHETKREAKQKAEIETLKQENERLKTKIEMFETIIKR